MDTKGHCFPEPIIIQAVYLKLRFSLSYRDVEEIMRIRGVEVDHATILRWVYKFTFYKNFLFSHATKSSTLCTIFAC